MFQNKLSFRSVLIAVLALLFSIAGCAWLTSRIFYPLIDANKCIPQTAERIGVEPTEDAIKEYIETELKPGLTREDVHQVLEKIAPIVVNRGEEGEDIALQMCNYPMNNLVIGVIYTSDGRLIRAYVDDF